MPGEFRKCERKHCARGPRSSFPLVSSKLFSLKNLSVEHEDSAASSQNSRKASDQCFPLKTAVAAQIKRVRQCESFKDGCPQHCAHHDPKYYKIAVIPFHFPCPVSVSDREPRNRALTDIVAAGDAALRLAGGDTFPGLVLLVRSK